MGFHIKFLRNFDKGYPVRFPMRFPNARFHPRLLNAGFHVRFSHVGFPWEIMGGLDAGFLSRLNSYGM